MAFRIKVYSRIREPVGHVIYRINREFLKRAPEVVEFVDYPKQADFQIVHCIGAGSLAKIWNKKFVLFQHCLLSADLENLAVWQGIFEHALMVVSYLDLPHFFGKDAFNFHRTPWGVDMQMFRNLCKTRTNGIMTTGWSLNQEAIEECYLAARRCHRQIINVGADFGFGKGFSAVSNITDKELCEVYNECEFVSGLRFKEGFELSVIEGLACGCRPICFDLPIFRYWFGDMAYYVHHCQGEPLAGKVETILRQPPRPISKEEFERLESEFHWKNIADRFWKKIIEYV